MKRLLLVLALLVSEPAWAGSGNMVQKVPEYHAADPDAAPVTESNVLASERF
jgi:hypothetical protein